MTNFSELILPLVVLVDCLSSIELTYILQILFWAHFSEGDVFLQTLLVG